MKPFAIAGMQMHLSALKSNVDHMEARLNLLMELYPWIQMVVFSELAPFGPLVTNAQAMPGPAEDRFCRMAQKHEIWLLPGSMFEKTKSGDIYNTASVIGPDGSVAGRFRKMFPFRPYETEVAAGDEFLVFDVPDVGRFGVSICYDMWFPETTRTLAALGAEVILHPTLTGTVDRDVELAIARASAAQNQCFFFDINGLSDGGNGRSIIIGPDGDILHQAGTSPEMMPFEINLERVSRSREVGIRGLGQQLKSFRDRKVSFDLYQKPAEELAYLNTLGPLAKPTRASRLGLDNSEENQ
jgi:predicted amidohydrolase